jgi:thiol-disulfide isomerase/thioredoxin
VALSSAYPPSARARARALAARAQAALTRKDASAVTDLDTALILLTPADAGERVPLYTLRLTAMEAAGAKPEDVRVFLQQHRDDPAATIAAEAALTAVQKLAGQPAPPLRLKRLDGKPGDIILADLRGAPPGQPVLIEVFATWCKPCALTAPAVSALAKRWRAKGVAVLGVSLDNKDTLAGLPAWIATYAIDYPVVGDGLGWDSEFAAAWHIDSIPRLILVDAQGIIVTAELGGATVAEVERNVDDAISQLLEPARLPVHQPNPPAAVDVIP